MNFSVAHIPFQRKFQDQIYAVALKEANCVENGLVRHLEIF